MNTTVFNTQIASFLCPSDAKMRPAARLSNYVGNVGGPMPDEHELVGTFIPTPTPDHQRHRTSSPATVKIASITDGTSNTSLFSEVLTGLDNPASVTPRANNPIHWKRVYFPTTIPTRARPPPR